MLFFINSRLVHAIFKGLVIAEIQQKSDIAYRVYDYGRPREIDVEKSLEGIDFEIKAERLVEDYNVFDGYKYTNLCESDYFVIDKCIINSKFNTSSDNECFSIVTCVEGKGLINYKNGSEAVNKGDSLLTPAKLGDYEIRGICKY